MRQAPDLDLAYATCRRIQRRHDPTYYVATRRLPSDVQPAVHALYAFVRSADEVVDGPRRRRDPAERRKGLDRWEAELERGRTAGGSDNPVVAALVDSGRRHDLPLDELRVYMRSMRIDCAPVRIDTWEELEAYMQGSAASVGRVMAPLLGAPPDRREDFARLGLAFQLTNFIRDVREDWGLDRLYLPAEDLRRFGVCQQDIARGHATPQLRELLAFEVTRARSLFAGAGDEAVAAVAPSVRPGMRLARAVYLRVLDRIEAIGFDVLGRRTDLWPWELGGAAMRSRRDLQKAR